MFRTCVFSLVSTATLLVAAPQPRPFHRPLVFEPNRGQAPGEFYASRPEGIDIQGIGKWAATGRRGVRSNSRCLVAHHASLAPFSKHQLTGGTKDGES